MVASDTMTKVSEAITLNFGSWNVGRLNQGASITLVKSMTR
jgi:hypothetical protein